MSEREVRSIIKAVMDQIDRRARRAVHKVVLPAMLGASVSLSVGCGDERAVTSDAGPDAQQVDSRTGPDAAYMAPDADAFIPPDMAVYMGPDAAYMAPDALPDLSPAYMGPDAAYMAPDAWLDGPPYPPYMGPDAAPAYMGPDAMAEDGPAPYPDAAVLYMAPNPDPGFEPEP